MPYSVGMLCCRLLSESAGVRVPCVCLIELHQSLVVTSDLHVPGICWMQCSFILPLLLSNNMFSVDKFLVSLHACDSALVCVARMADGFSGVCMLPLLMTLQSFRISSSVELYCCWCCCCQTLDGDYYERVQDFLTSLARTEQTSAITANDCFQRVVDDASKVKFLNYSVVMFCIDRFSSYTW